MISHVTSDKKPQQILKDLFIRCRKLNIAIYFLTQSHFSVPKDVRLNCTHYILFKLNNRTELQNMILIIKILLRFMGTVQDSLLIF